MICGYVVKTQVKDLNFYQITFEIPKHHRKLPMRGYYLGKLGGIFLKLSVLMISN